MHSEPVWLFPRLCVCWIFYKRAYGKDVYGSWTSEPLPHQGPLQFLYYFTRAILTYFTHTVYHTNLSNEMTGTPSLWRWGLMSDGINDDDASKTTEKNVHIGTIWICPVATRLLHIIFWIRFQLLNYQLARHKICLVNSVSVKMWSHESCLLGTKLWCRASTIQAHLFL